MKKVFAIFFVIGALLLAGTAYLVIQQCAFINSSQSTMGIVVNYTVSKSESSNDKSSHYYPIITFITQSGQTVTFKSSSGTSSPSYQRGEKVEVLYDLNNPSNASINSFMSIWIAPILVGILGSVFFLVGLIFFIIVRRKNNLKRELLNNGRRIQATINSVEFNTSLSVNGRSPYVIYSQWRDPLESNSVYIFESENIWFNPEPYITKETISVFIDEKNPRRYYVDIDFLPKVK